MPANSKSDSSHYVEGILNGNRAILAKSITLAESNSDKHINTAQEVLNSILPNTGKSIRIGITGTPGVGKSTLIESLGTHLCNHGYKVAVLAVDPSSSLSKGSILGDKTRMEELARNENAFIRPSPSGTNLGGVARKTRESMLMCEAAGFDVILIETVGVGQSEVTVRSMCDFYLLMLLPGSGDELQGIKKGSVELADAIVINKAEGTQLNFAKLTKRSYENALHLLQNPTDGWQSKVFMSSAINNEGIIEIWDTIQLFEEITKRNGYFYKRRSNQLIEWMDKLLDDEIKKLFFKNKKTNALYEKLKNDVLNNNTTPLTAVRSIISGLYSK